MNMLSLSEIITSNVAMGRYPRSSLMSQPQLLTRGKGVFEFHCGRNSTQMPQSAPFLYVHEELQAWKEDLHLTYQLFKTSDCFFVHISTPSKGLEDYTHIIVT